MMTDTGDLNLEDVSKYKLVNCDFRSITATSIQDETIDLIFTDPPYDHESVSLYGSLGNFASRVLKPGGSLVTYAGNYALPLIFDYMKNCGLGYWWEMAVKHNGGFRSLHHKQVAVMWKPLLWFVKGSRLKTTETLGDLIESKPPDKNLNVWAQSTIEAGYVISKLTMPNDVVVDPLMGSGTTGIAALNLKRKFVGIEKDTRVRLSRQKLGIKVN